jgi:hypothetical protein
MFTTWSTHLRVIQWKTNSDMRHAALLDLSSCWIHMSLIFEHEQMYAHVSINLFSHHHTFNTQGDTAVPL